MRHTTDLVHIPTTHPSHDIQDTDDTDNRTHLQSLRSAILTHLATALATAAQKIARDAAGDDPFGDNHDLAKRTHSLLQILPNLLPLLPEPDDDDDRDYRHPNADRLMAEIRDEEERQQVLLPECPFCDLPSDHTPENCPANPDGLPAQRAAQLRLKHAELLALHHAHPPTPPDHTLD